MIKKVDEKALLLLSGGQDSITCLGWALNVYAAVVAVSFNYGQQHVVELEAASKVASMFGVEHHVLSTDLLTQLGSSALLASNSEDVNEKHAFKKDLPASYVPNRNALMLTATHALAQKLGITRIITGVCQTDYSGYPDCRDSFIKAIENALNLGSESDIIIDAPLMYLDKKDTFALADEVGILPVVLTDSRTCYNGSLVKNDWGTGCGDCPACGLKEQGFMEFMEASNNGTIELKVPEARERVFNA